MITAKEKYQLADFLIGRQAAFYRSLAFLVGEARKWKERGSSDILVPTTIMEFGVWNGKSLSMIWKALQNVNGYNEFDWNFYGFDSFEGLPAPAGFADEHPIAGEGAFCSTGIDNVYSSLSEVGLTKVKLIPGWYEDSLTPELKEGLGTRKVGFVNIDVDYYSSTVTVLDWLEDLLVDGSIVFFDDILFYNGNPNKGNIKAIEEFNAKSKNRGLYQSFRFDPCGRTYLFWKNEEASTNKIRFST